MRQVGILLLGIFIAYFIIQISIPLRYTLNADEGTHALIGLFYKDLLNNIGNFKSFSDVTSFAVDYIIKYPKLSAHYPPLYHWLLSIVFFISESLILVRIFNIFLTIATAYTIYKLSFKLSKNKEIAFISLIFFLSFSIIFFYADKIMVDNLQILTFSLGLIYYLALKEKKTISKINIFILGVIFALAFLTKFFSLFLPIIIIIDSFLTKRNMLKYIIISGFISLVILSPYIYFYIKFGLYKIAANVAFNPQIVNIGKDIKEFFNFFGFDYLNFLGRSKIEYFNFFKIFGLFSGVLVAFSTIWYLWENKKNFFVVSWMFLPLILFLILFTDVELRFLYVLMPLFALSCGTFIYKILTENRGLKKSMIILSIIALLISQFAINIYIKIQEPFYPVESIIRNAGEDGNILIMQEMSLDKGAYSSVYILYSRLTDVKGNIIRPCILEENNLSNNFLNDMKIKYIIDNNKTIDEDVQQLLKIKLLGEEKIYDSSIRIFERTDYYSTETNCNFICNLGKEVCKGENISDILSN